MTISCSSKGFGLLLLWLCLLVSRAVGSAVQVVGYIMIRGVFSALVESSVKSALESDLITILRSSGAQGVLEQVLITTVTSGSPANRSRFEFHVHSANSLTSDDALKMSAALSAAITVNSSASALNATFIAYSQLTSITPSEFVAESSGCSLASRSAEDDSCGPFSCFGFAMAALLVCLVLCTIVGIYCCCVRHGRQRKYPLQQLALNTATDPPPEDDDPFAPYDNIEVQAQHVVAVPVQPRSAESATSSTNETASSFASASTAPLQLPVVALSPPLSPRKANRSVSFVHIDEPQRPSTPLSISHSLPAALLNQNSKGFNVMPRNDNSATAQHSTKSSAPRAEASLTIDEERLALERQKWIWEHLES